MTTHDLSEEYIKDVMSCNKECFVCDKCTNAFDQLFAKHPSAGQMLRRTIPITLHQESLQQW